MAIYGSVDSVNPQRGERPASGRTSTRLAANASALVLGSLMTLSPAAGLQAASAPATCKFSPSDVMSKMSAVEPYLIIDATCIDPDYNDSSFVIDKTEQLTYQVPGGPLIPYTEVTGHFPATKTLETIAPGIVQSPTLFEQKYVFKFPAKAHWKNRTMLQQHPTGGGMVDPRMAFTNGAITISWRSNSVPNAVASHRHQAAATKFANSYANRLYGNRAKIYNYFWGCSGGGIVSMGAAENSVGVWDGVQPQCMGPTGTATFHSFFWQAHYTMAIPQAKRDAIAAAALPGGTGDIYAGLNEEEKAVLNEFIGAGYPLQIIGNHFRNFVPLVDPIDIRMEDESYEDDFWSKPGYAGANPPNYLKAALTDGWATVTAIDRDASGAPTKIHFDPATLPRLGTIGDSYLEFWVYGPDGKTRLIDSTRAAGVPTLNKRRYSLLGNYEPAAGTLEVVGKLPQGFERGTPITNSPLLLGAVKVGSKVRINNRFILSIYFYPRYSNIPGARSYDQYRNADGTAKYPQRRNVSVLALPNYRTMGGRIETGAVKTRTMIMEGMGDNLSWPIFNASYAESIQRTLGAARSNDMMRFYLHDNGSHSTGGGIPGIFQQSIQDLMAWVEKGIAPPPSTRYTIRNGQVIAAPQASNRFGLQPVMNLTVDGVTRATVGLNMPVDLAARIEMPPKGGQVVQYNWTITRLPPGDTGIAPPAAPGMRAAPPPREVTADPVVNIDKPQPLINVSRTVSFDKPGTYVVRLTVNGQRDGQVNPANQTLLTNWKEVRVVVQ